jgi:transcription initiation factor TFIIA large subunit
MKSERYADTVENGCVFVGSESARSLCVRVENDHKHKAVFVTFDVYNLLLQTANSFQTWQSKLSERKVASMPWDPTPVAPSAPQAASAVTTQASSMPSQVSQPDTKPPTQTSTQSSAPSHTAGDPTIKSEPGAVGYDLQNLPQSNGMASYSNSSGAALDRTSQQLREKFGASAAPQINQLQARRAQMINQNAHQQPQGQAQGANSQAALEAKRREYEMQQAQRHKASLAAQQQRAVGSAQTDGASDWASFAATRRAHVAADGGAADNSLREMLEASSMAMEGGGLLLPVSQRPSQPSAARLASAPQPSSASAQYDGPGDDDDKDDIKEEDEDAINSDLDDSEDELNKEEDDEDANQGEIMLCTYDKVQRVKNKWKCTLKDGVLTTGGKE